jgi:hypothetical protein
MEKIKDKDITVTRHAVDDFTLSCVHGAYQYHRRYMRYSVREAKRRLKEYVYEEDGKIFRNVSRNDVLLGALQCLCAGDLGSARELLGNS